MSKTKQSSYSAERVLAPTLGILVGFMGGYAIRFATEPSDTQSENSVIASLKRMNVLEKTRPCRNEPLKLEHNNKRYVVTDTRCDIDKNPDIDIFGVTSNSLLGPIARVKNGTVLEADCIAPGELITTMHKTEKYDSSDWVRVSVVDTDGVVFLTEESEGYINSLEVVGESNLPECRETPPDVTRTI